MAVSANLSQAISTWIKGHAEELLQLTEALIRFPSENQVPKGFEKECQVFIAETLRGLSMDLDIFEPTEVPGLVEHPLYWPGRDYADRPDVVGTWHGQAPDAGRSLLFSGHADVVTGNTGGRFPPFQPVREEGKLYGRGSNDMKGGLAACTFAVRCLQELGIRLKGNLKIESVVDEEMAGSNGTLAARLRGHNADACIVPEPNGMLVSPAHRGGCVWEITLAGTPGMPFGAEALVNPAYGIAHLAVAIEEWEHARNARLVTPPLYAAAPGLPVILSRVVADDFGEGVGDGVPSKARLEVWTEEYPGTSFEEHYEGFIGHLKRVAADIPVVQKCEMRVKQVTRFIPGSAISPDHPIVQAVCREFAEVLGREPEVQGAPFACDVFVFNLYSPTPCVLLGPRGGNAHVADEWVMTRDLLDLANIFALTAIDWCGLAD